MAKGQQPRTGDRVRWETPQGPTRGKIVGKVTRTEAAGGHVARATKASPQYRVKSAKSGKEAIHRGAELRKA